MTKLKFVCVIGSVREGRLADRIVKFLKKQFDEVMKPKGHTLEIIDPEKYDLPVLKKPLHFYQDWSQAPEVLHVLNKLVSEADAYIIVTAEYNRSLPPGLTNLLNHLPPPSFEYKPSGLLGYSMGPGGGQSACVAARPFLAEMGCLPVKTMTQIGTAHKEVTEDGTTENTHIASSVTKLLKEIEWWGICTKNGRDNQGLPK